MFDIFRYSACKVWFPGKMGERTVMEERTMRQALYVIFAVIALCVSSCNDTASRYIKEINEAERLMQSNADSAVAILDHIDPTNFKVDSLRAKYHYLLAFGHMRQNRS
ncbi:MAG: hypothetical protein K2H18_02810, partial [Muribaculaceae bacterium]|nr:hypothetical protein [Muribaculaceae bacterium]